MVTLQWFVRSCIVRSFVCVFRTDLHKMKINTELCCKRSIFWQKRPKTISLSELLSWITIFKSIHMAFYVNTSWACALLRNNKQHVVFGQKRKCQRVEESGLWRIQRERWIEVKYLPNGSCIPILPLWIRQSPLSSTRWHFLFCPNTAGRYMYY